MKTTMTPFVSRLAIIGVTAAAGMLLASCGKQESESASAPATMESMPDDGSDAKQDSMKDMPMPEASPSSPSAPATSGTQTHMSKGTIQSVDREAGTVKIAHEAVPSLNWPAMTMDFKVSQKEELAGLEEGKQVEFQLAEESAGQYVITAISPQR